MAEFGIVPCCKCNKTPTVNKDNNKTNELRYTVSHCGIEAHGKTETQCIVNWNKLQMNNKQENIDAKSND